MCSRKGQTRGYVCYVMSNGVCYYYSCDYYYYFFSVRSKYFVANCKGNESICIHCGIDNERAQAGTTRLRLNAQKVKKRKSDYYTDDEGSLADAFYFFIPSSKGPTATHSRCYR